MNLTLSDLELMPGARLSGRRPTPRARRATGVSTDSRHVAPGNVFFALKGEKFDGHAFALQAARAGAMAVVVDEAFEVPSALKRMTLVVTVDDTTKALGDLALIYRMKFEIPLIAVGGSNGKTTTKEMIARVLGEKFTVLSTEGNLNNHIGVPQMLFRMKPSTEVAVLELGTNHFGELQYLCSLALPTHAVVTNVGREHLEFFGSLEGVAEEETELFRFMQATAGQAFVNLDDARLARAARGLEGAITFGTREGAHCRARNISLDAQGRARFDCSMSAGAKATVRRYELGAAGMHNVSNALAAIAIGRSFGVTPAAMARALKGFTSAAKRMEILKRATGIVILNDTYNANPDSMEAAFQTLMAIETTGRKIAVLGDMFELGASAESEHTRVGEAVGAAHPHMLVTVGTLARRIHDAAASGIRESYHCTTKEEALGLLQRLVTPGDAVLVKGSRGMAMEEIVAHL